MLATQGLGSGAICHMHVMCTFCNTCLCCALLKCTTSCLRFSDIMCTPRNQKRFIFECLATAVYHVHYQGFTHHDLKARNFVRFFDGRFKLVDFDNCRETGKEAMGNTSIEICPPEVGAAPSAVHRRCK